MRKKKVNIGDVFVIPLKENRYGYGQVVSFGILLVRSNLVYIEKGYWKVLGNAGVPSNINIPKYYIRDGLDHFEVVTPIHEKCNVYSWRS
ncbi:hypothetical protein BK126_15470 [Paenibacillus sp. FSL H7-0326]|uniref:Imm26 family immunity protein n=1 Tax=Paenibacillus sp. FSL H7-0326 TaxID=1921144 RepID=UPI00096C92F3|nr:hypothetical protein BK126_15470 [Paenibacillus sp. FSL H7-0326]